MSERCLSLLTDLHGEGFSRKAQRRLTGSQRTISHTLPFLHSFLPIISPSALRRFSISGVQDKASLKLLRGELVATDSDGEYILKPIPSTRLPKFSSEVPANEHITMQIAGQIFGIHTPPNACVRFADGEIAYIVKRFDRTAGKKMRQEDFAQLGGRTEAAHGLSYKYDSSYEEVGSLLRRYCPAYKIEVEKLFLLIMFNYAFSNGDAHLKNFSLLETLSGDFILSPAYDLLCTSLHLPDESRLALDLFADGYESPSYQKNGFYMRRDFLELARRLGIQTLQAERLCSLFADRRLAVETLVARSFLSPKAQADYRSRFRDRLLALKMK